MNWKKCLNADFLAQWTLNFCRALGFWVGYIIANNFVAFKYIYIFQYTFCIAQKEYWNFPCPSIQKWSRVDLYIFYQFLQVYYKIMIIDILIITNNIIYMVLLYYSRSCISHLETAMNVKWHLVLNWKKYGLMVFSWSCLVNFAALVDSLSEHSASFDSEVTKCWLIGSL